MTDPHIPVTEDELHAYVDNPDDAARVQSWRTMAEALHTRYDSVVDEAVPKRLEIERLVREPRKWVYGAIAATLAAFVVGGGVGWMARGAAAAPSAFQNFTLEALEAHRLYVVEVRHPVEVPGSERAHLQAWLTKRCGWIVRAPELTAAGLKLIGGRLLPGPTGPASFMMYESASGERFTIYTAKSEAEATQMRFSSQGKESALFWSDRGVAYVVSGVGDRGRLTQIAQSVYDQMDKTGG
jgi:anti-sigma factor RsiW